MSGALGGDGSGGGGGPEELAALAERWVGEALPGEQVEVVVGRSTSTTVRTYRAEVESFTSATNFGVGIRVIVDGRQGFAHAGTFDETAIKETLADARDNAAFAEPDEWAGLATPDGVAATRQELWLPAVGATAAERKVELALELERATLALDPRVRGVRVCTYSDSEGDFALASTTGLRAANRSSSCWTSVSALAEQDGETQIGYGVDVGRDPEALDLAAVAAEAVAEATGLLGARKVPTQRLALLLEPKQAATILGIVAGTLTGDVVVKQRSPFGDRLGQLVASPLLTLVDDPTDARSIAADSHDGEGLACRRNVLIESGVLQRFLHNSYTGRRMGTASTGSAVRTSRSLPSVGVQAMATGTGERNRDELLAGIDVGFLVQSMNGLHSGVNPTSGDFSVGAEGRMIRGGELAEPVREVTIASTLQRLLTGIVAVGAEIEWLPSGAGCAALVIGEVALSGS